MQLNNSCKSIKKVEVLFLITRSFIDCVKTPCEDIVAEPVRMLKNVILSPPRRTKNLKSRMETRSFVPQDDKIRRILIFPLRLSCNMNIKRSCLKCSEQLCPEENIHFGSS